MPLEVGVFLVLLGFLLAIYTGNLFPDSSKGQRQFEEIKKKKEQGHQLLRKEEGQLTYFKLNRLISIVWKYIAIAGLFIFAVSFFVN